MRRRRNIQLKGKPHVRAAQRTVTSVPSKQVQDRAREQKMASVTGVFATLKKSKQHVRKVQLGAGSNCPEDWINLDVAGSNELDIVQDLREPLPFPDNSIEEFYSHHVLEHFTVPELSALMREIRRCLKPGGLFTSRLPDFEHIVKQLIVTLPGERYDILMGHVYGRQCYGATPLPEHWHRYGWTATSMRRQLEKCGFIVLECHSIGSSEILPCIDLKAIK